MKDSRFHLPGVMNMHQAAGWIARELTRCGIDSARVCAEALVMHLAGWDRRHWLLHSRNPLSEELREALPALAERLAAHEPLQYVVGETRFRGRDFLCDHRALIPRPETEELVDRVLGCRPLWETRNPLLVDVGTGTGCIACTLALERPAARVVALDISEAALELARDNARRLGAQVLFQRADLLTEWAQGPLQAVVANPPYVERDELAGLDPHVRDHEPRLALDGGVDGLDPLRRLVPQAAALLAPSGWFFAEIGEKQGSAAIALLERADFDGIGLYKDFTGHDRFIVAQRRPTGK